MNQDKNRNQGSTQQQGNLNRQGQQGGNASSQNPFDAKQNAQQGRANPQGTNPGMEEEEEEAGGRMEQDEESSSPGRSPTQGMQQDRGGSNRERNR